MTKQNKKVEQESMTFFEMQEEAWFDNNCQGNIEDYDGTEVVEKEHKNRHG